jgi:hypothetical protein
VLATDTAGKSASCNVDITVIRDAAPVFSPTSYYKQIPETEAVNGPTPFIIVTANDPDKKVGT